MKHCRCAALVTVHSGHGVNVVIIPILYCSLLSDPAD